MAIVSTSYYSSSVLPRVARAPVKNSRSVLKISLKRLRASQNMQIVDDGTAAQIEKILACSPVAGASALPPTYMGQCMFHCYPLTKFCSSLRCQLSRSQLDQQGFVRMNAHAASLGTGGALGFQRTLGACVFGEVDNPARLERHFLLSRTPNHLPVPIEGKRLLREVFPLANRPGFAIDFHFITPLMHEMATQIAPVDVEFLDPHCLLL